MVFCFVWCTNCWPFQVFSGNRPGTVFVFSLFLFLMPIWRPFLAKKFYPELCPRRFLETNKQVEDKKTKKTSLRTPERKCEKKRYERKERKQRFKFVRRERPNQKAQQRQRWCEGFDTVIKDFQLDSPKMDLEVPDSILQKFVPSWRRHFKEKLKHLERKGLKARKLKVLKWMQEF